MTDVYVGVELAVPNENDFIIGDPTRGVIGLTDYTLGTGYTPVDADSYHVHVTRGRFSRLWDSIDAGTCTVNLINETRDYDPAHIDSPYNRYLTPGRRVRIAVDDVPIWTGYVDDWDLIYSTDNPSFAVLKSTDALGQLGQIQFDAWTSSATTANGKLTAVCERAEVAWPSPLRAFDEGAEVLQSENVSHGSSVLHYLQLIARSELGYLWADPVGVLTYRDRQNIGAGDAVVQLADDGTGIGFDQITATVGTDVLFARVSVDREGGTAQSATVSNVAAWTETNGPALRSLILGGLLLATDAQSLALAGYLLDLYDTARYRISSVVVSLHGLDAGDRADMLALDIGAPVDCTYTPDQVGAPIHQRLLVQGIVHDITPTTHTVTLSLVERPIAYFRIGDAVLGVIGSNILAF